MWTCLPQLQTNIRLEVEGAKEKKKQSTKAGSHRLINHPDLNPHANLTVNQGSGRSHLIHFDPHQRSCYAG
jgi:hypothetical protein